MELAISINYVIAFFMIQIGVLFFKQWNDERKKHLQNVAILSFGFYFLFFGLAMFLIFYITTHVLPAPVFELYIIIGIMIRGIGVTIFSIVLEYSIKRIFNTRYLISLTLICLLCVFPFFYGNISFQMAVNTISLAILILPIIFTLYFIKYTYGEVQKKLKFTALPGFILFCISLYFTSPRMLESIETLLIYPAFLVFPLKLVALFGMVLVIYGYYGYSFFLESQWRENLVSLHIIDAKRMASLYSKKFLSEAEIVSKDVFAGGIPGLEALIKEFTDANKEVEQINLEKNLIILSHGEKIITAMIVRKYLQHIKYILKQITQRFEMFYWDYLRFYKYYDAILTPEEMFEPMENIIHEIIKV